MIFRVAENWFCKLRVFFRLEKSGSANSEFFLVGESEFAEGDPEKKSEFAEPLF